MCVFQALLERTGYTLDVTTGQRKYGGPPPEDVFKGTHPGSGTEVEKRLSVMISKAGFYYLSKIEKI